MECQYCSNTFGNKSSLTNHQKNARYCLKLRDKKVCFLCNYCKKDYSSKYALSLHTVNCQKIYSSLEEKIETKTNSHKDRYIIKLESQIKELQDKLADVAKTAINNSYYEQECTIDIVDEEGEKEEDEEYKLTPLDVGKGFSIEHREEDGYINVTNLCKAGGKEFKHWKSLQRTKAFLQVLSSSVVITTADLIKLGTGSNHDSKHTWVHPQVAINIAQWISPNFDVKISAWIYEVMMTGKVDISSTKSYRQLQSENKDHKLKIQFLTKKYVKKQPRVQFDAKNVIYILTTALMKKERRYILGKAQDLTSRLSTYNKSDEHEVVFYQSCPDEDTMGVVETLVFQKLKEHREQANRERFILPEGSDIGIFKDTIKKCLEFVGGAK